MHLILGLNIRRYPYWVSLERIFETILSDFSFRVPYSSLENNAKKLHILLKSMHRKILIQATTIFDLNL